MTLGKGIEQLQVFAVFWAFACIATVVYWFVNSLLKAQLYKVIFDVIFSVAVVPLFLLANLHFNNGEFRLFWVVAIACGVLTSCICFGRTLDKFASKLYNLFTKPKVDNNGKGIL